MTRSLLVAALTIVIGVPMARADLAEGNWRLSQKFTTGESPLMLIKVEKKDGTLSASVIDKAAPKAPYSASDLKVDGSTVTLTVELGRKFTFEGAIDAKDGHVVRGCFYDDAGMFRAVLTKQEGDKIERPEAPKPPEPIAEARKLSLAVSQAMMAARQSKDQNEKADLQAKVTAARKELDEKSPALYREVIAKQADSPFAVDAANSLLRISGKLKPSADEATTWVKLIVGDAKMYGARVARDSTLSAAETLVGQKMAAAALPFAEEVVNGLKEKDPLSVQSRALKTLLAAETAAGKTDAAIPVRLAKIEKSLDDEYVQKVPPFKPEKFAGRKDKAANRVAVMELFTGAQCPPCVAADAAFDALEKAYDSKDLILIQYHMHIPGPDPLTNKDTIARWDYYREKFPQQMGGVPSSVFNGKPQAGGGGGMPNAESKFKQYSGIVGGLLEEKTELKVGGSAKRAGDMVNIALDLDGVGDPGEKLKLRVLLVEEKIKYVGGNGMRFHHQVVRALAGGAAGTPVTEKALKKSVDVDLAEVRKTLTKYLEDFAAETPFPNPERPMDLAHLKVIAFVQNDATGEILNAAEFPVEGK
jgi:hypothetical protein